MAGRLNASRTIASADREVDQESLASFQSGPISAKPPIKYAWSGNGQVIICSSMDSGAYSCARTLLQQLHTQKKAFAGLLLMHADSSLLSWLHGQVDHDTYHRMLEEYRAAKQKEGKDELKIKQ
jgi:hypothetical protein